CEARAGRRPGRRSPELLGDHYDREGIGTGSAIFLGDCDAEETRSSGAPPERLVGAACQLAKTRLDLPLQEAAGGLSEQLELIPVNAFHGCTILKSCRDHTARLPAQSLLISSVPVRAASGHRKGDATHRGRRR